MIRSSLKEIFSNSPGEKGLGIVEATNRNQIQRFVDLPWTIYKDDPLWAPPLKMSVKSMINFRKHPFWQQADGKLFLAERDGRTVGRICALIDHNSNRYHNERIASWGFFECIEDQDVADCLFRAVGDWCLDQGFSEVRGPLNPSTNYEIGTLIKGFEQAPALMMSYNPPYYPGLIHRAGFRKEKDVLSYRLSRETVLPDWIYNASARIRESENIHVSCPKKWNRENIRLMCEIYKQCWADNWGFIPMSEAEEDELAKELLFLIEPELAFFIQYRDEPVGIGLLLPDFNPLLKRFNGKLGATALIKKYLYMPEVVGLRGLLFGIKPEYRKMGLHLVAIDHVLSVLQSLEKYQYAELGWTLEDNDGINNLFMEANIRPAKRYRIYRKSLRRPGS